MRDALIQAFDRDEFIELAAEAVNLHFDADIAPGNFKTQLKSAIEWCERRGATSRLLVAAEKKRPDHRELLAALNPVKETLIAESAAVFVPGEPETEFRTQLQRVVRPELGFADVAIWRQSLLQVERAVCRVELTQGTGDGTGFLLAKDLAITCYHVIERLVGRAPEKARDAVVRFDYKRNPEGNPIRDREFRLAPEWLVAWSATADLDYALLRVSANPGEEQMGPEAARTPRHWLRLSREIPQKGHPVQILQHPKTLPMKLAFGTVGDISGHRLSYDANTDEGSSGSPVLTADWQVVALHRDGGATRNRGILCAPILRDLETKGIAALLG